MKIRYLIMNAYGVGGTIRTVINQANAMAARHDVELVSVFRTRRTPAFPVDPRVRLRVLADPGGPRWRHPLRTLLARQPSRLVPSAEARHATFNRYSDARIAGYLRSLHGGVLVTTRPALNLMAARFAPDDVVRVAQEHMHLDSHKPELAAEIARWYPRLDAVVTLTQADTARYAAVLDGTGTELASIPNALTPGERRPADLADRIVVAAGRLTRQKGFDLLIEAFADVADAYPDWQLRIYGDGKERARLRQLIHRRHLYNHVFLMGGTTALEEEFAKSAVFVLSSRFEGFGMVLVEAMAHGLPVAAFDCPHGPGEIVTHGTDGLLVPPRDVSGLAAAIGRLIADEPLRHRLGSAARATAGYYAMDDIRLRWERLFTDLAAARTPALRLGAAGLGRSPGVPDLDGPSPRGALPR
ncbi:glycosyltransferase family 4 protein [Microtetraspora malaysiensis]|uniref:glycosyltransferase family 4 protein n=1 Tax=Microtetraspora malaysiensis TaxID=161358 RepID=UPI003D8C1596